jgi:DNA-binding transcriptional ArsR family regulator
MVKRPVRHLHPHRGADLVRRPEVKAGPHSRVDHILQPMTGVHALPCIYGKRYVRPMDAFVVVAEPTRRRILDRLRRTELSVGDLVADLDLSQPTVSKHLRVLRDAGFVSVDAVAQRRIYRIEAEPLRELDGWIDPYRQLWARHLDALERHLDRRKEQR